MLGTEHSKAGEAVNPLGGKNSLAAPTRKCDRRHGAGVSAHRHLQIWAGSLGEQAMGVRSRKAGGGF